MERVKILTDELEFYKNKFKEFTKISISLSKEKDLDKLLSEIVFFGRDFTHAEAGTLYGYDDFSLKFNVIQNESLNIDLNRSKNEIHWDDILINGETTNLVSVYCAAYRKPINIEDVYTQTQYDFSGTKKFDEKNGYKTKSVLVVPIINPENDKLLGVLQLINKKDIDGNVISFSKDDEDLALSLASQSAVILERLEGEIQYLRELNKQLEEQKTQLEYLANTDQLTKIANRLKFNSDLKYEFMEAQTHNNPLSFIIFDIDHFKKVNDTYGHKVGDYVLESLAKVVTQTIPKEYLYARWGGEEFVILMPKSDENEAYNLAQKVRVAIESFSFKYVQKVTCSFGVSQMKKDDDQEDFIIRADEALYESKQNGRNMVTIK